MAKNLLKLLPKPPNVYSINTATKYYISESSILTILKATKVLKLDNLSGHFSKTWTFLSKPISDLCILLISSETFPDSCKVAKLKPLYTKGSLTLSCNYRPISLLALISKVIEKDIQPVITCSKLTIKQVIAGWVISLVFEKNIRRIPTFLIWMKKFGWF